MENNSVIISNVDQKLLEEQIDAILNSNMSEYIKAGIHNLLGTIFDQLEDNRKKDLEPISVGMYKHYKGEYYIVIGEGVHTETNEKFVIYTKYTSTGFPIPIFNGLTKVFNGLTKGTLDVIAANTECGKSVFLEDEVFWCRPKKEFNGYTNNGEKRFVKIS